MTPASTSTPSTAGQEWRAYGLLVLSAMAGVSLGTIPHATLGLFMDPLHREFGWSRTEISLGLTIFALASLPLTPLGGVLVDKFGARRVAIPGVAISGAVFACFGLLTGAYIQWLIVWLLYTIASVGTRSLVWNTAISGAFTTSRGMAIAVLLCGTAVATAVAPSIARWLIDNWGWRGAYLGFGFGWAGVALALVLLFFHDKRSASRTRGTKAQPAAAQLPGGLTVGEALRSLRIYRLAIAMFLQSTMGVAIMVHLVPMLTADGLSRAEAAGMAGVMGIASIIGKLATGFLIDRLAGSLLPVACFSGPALGYVLLLQSPGSAWLLTGAVFVLGYCSGASLQLTTYLTTRYAGLRNFGTIFGLMSALMALSTGIGPPLAGAIFDTTGSYTILLMLGIPAALTAGALVFGLGPYPEFKPDDATSEPGFTGAEKLSEA